MSDTDRDASYWRKSIEYGLRDQLQNFYKTQADGWLWLQQAEGHVFVVKAEGTELLGNDFQTFVMRMLVRMADEENDECWRMCWRDCLGRL